MGDSAWRLDLPDGSDPVRALAALRKIAGVMDVVVTDREVMVVLCPGARCTPEAIEVLLREAARETGSAMESREVVIALRYDGTDLGWIAERTGLSVAEVIARHEAGVYRVEFLGFVPGFAYLGGLDEGLVLPRRDVPRPRVPVGSVAIAGRRTAVYPAVSPGGWHLVGTAVDFVALDPQRGATLRAGDSVRFARVP